MPNPNRPSRPRVTDDFDGAWKNMLSERRFMDFIAFFLPELLAQIDSDRPVEFLEQELRAITRKTKRGSRSVDRLVRVWLKTGEERSILVHVEFQSQFDATFQLRMFQYYYRAIDLFGDRVIESIAILGDDDSERRPSTVERIAATTRIKYEFRINKLIDYMDRLAEFETSRNPFARFVVAHLMTIATKSNPESRLEWKIRIIKGLYDVGSTEEEIGQLYHDFDWLLALPELQSAKYHENMTQFEEEQEVPHLTTAERIGIKKGRAEGRAEGKEELLLQLIEHRFGTADVRVRERIHLLGPRQLNALGLALFDFGSIEDVNPWLSSRRLRRPA